MLFRSAMNSNFDRSLSREDVMRRRASLLQRLHIDGQLLLLLVILISGGLYKAGIIRAILTAGYVNHLVTDEAVARKLLGQD